MKDDIPAHIHEIIQAGQAIKQFITGLTFEQYTANELIRSAVERKFEIMGEALNRIKRDSPDILVQIRDHRDIISFRNILVHGYDTIDDRIVWGVIKENLDHLIADATQLTR